MLFRRKLITNIIWIFAMIVIVIMGAQYAFLYGIDFLFAGDGFLAQLTSVSYTALDIGLLLSILLYLGLCTAVFFIGRGLYRLISRKTQIKNSTVGLIRILLTCVVFIAAIVYRGYLLISSGVVILADSTYFDVATGMYNGVSGPGEIAIHGASYAYVMILYFMMQFLGDRVVAVLLLQTVIQILTILLVFAALKRLVNYPAAVFAALFLTFSPLYSSKLFTSSPGCFVALLLILAFFLIACFMKIKGGALKIILGLIFGLVIGYLVYMDAVVIVFLFVWFMAFIYDAGDRDEKGIVPGYLLMLLGAVIGAAFSIALDGGFDPDGISIAAQTWWKVTYSSGMPEYALIDYTSGVYSLIQCMILTGIALMTVMGTIGRSYIEYELPWLLMFVCALTPMTCIGYLHDNTISFIIYTGLAGAGFSSMFHLPDPSDEDEEENGDEDEATDTDAEIDGETFDDVSASVPDGEEEPDDGGLEFESLSTPDEDADDEVEFESLLDDAPESTEDVSEGSVPETGDALSESPVPEPADTVMIESAQEAATPEAEELPTSIPWAKIKALDDDVDEYALTDSEDDSSMVFTSANSGFNVVVPGADFTKEEVYVPEESDGTDDTVQAADNSVSADNGYIKQVDELPGMIPNPLPLPKKKAPQAIDFDRDFDIDDDDDNDDLLDWDVVDNDDDSDDDFDI